MSHPTVCFGEFRLDPARRELWRDGQPLVLPPKVFDCIAYLVAHRERAVGRDELIAAVWGRTDVTDNLLDQVMLRARRALGDTGDPRRYIRTMPRFGFGWVAPVSEADDDATEVEAEPAPLAPLLVDADTALVQSETTLRPRHLRAWLLLPALAVLLLASALWMWSRQPASQSPQATALVLPIAVKAEGPFGWLRFGLMDLVAERLRLTGHVIMPSDNVVALTRDGGPWPRGSAAAIEIARTSGVSIVVDGEAALVEGRWRVGLRTLGGNDPEIRVEAEASDVLDAARLASDRLESALGWTPESDPSLPADATLALLLRQVDAAQLADQTDVARRLLESTQSAQRELPEVRFRLAALDFREGKLELAQQRFESLLEGLPPDDSPLLRARVLTTLGNVHMRRDQPALTEALSDQAVELLAGLPPSTELGRALTGRAISRSLQERFDAAMDDFARARIVLESVGDRYGLARVDLNIGILDARRYRYAEALPALAAAADRLTAYRDFSSELYARVSLARARLELLDAPAALAGDERLRELIQMEPSQATRRYAQLVRAMVQQANGRLRAGNALLDEVRSEAAAAGDAVTGAAADALAAQAALAAGDAAGATEAARHSLDVAWSAEGPLDYARTWRVLVLARQQAGDAVDARNVLDRFKVFATTSSDGGVQTQHTLAEAALADGDAARRAYEHAVEQAEARRVPAELLDVARSYVPWLIGQGDRARASVLAGRSAGWAGSDYEAALLQLRFQHAFGNVAGWRNSLERVRESAGERVVPAGLLEPPLPRGPAIAPPLPPT